MIGDLVNRSGVPGTAGGLSPTPSSAESWWGSSLAAAVSAVFLARAVP